MTRHEWYALAESQREAIRQASARQSLERPHRARDPAMDVWAARDAYKVQNTVLGIAGLLLAVLALAVLGRLLH